MTQRKKAMETPPTDPSEYRIQKEGEAEILLHGNDVFYNPTQVVNRDFSIAILRTFVDKWKEEYDAFWTNKRKQKLESSKQVQSGAITDDGNDDPKEDDKVDKLNETSTETESGPVENSNGKASSDDVVHEETLTDARVWKKVSDKTMQFNGPEKPVVKKIREELEPLKVLEALAASGLRSLRYAREVDGISKVIALDNNKVAVESCKKNIKLNGSSVSLKVEPHLTDARVYMLTHEKEFHVVDLDPYGSPDVFLDTAVQSVADGGMLFCTATDMAVLCGNNGEACYGKYGAYPTRGKYCHEMALRILLACIESHANRYKRYIVPVLSLSVDFYIRVFVRVFTCPNAVRYSPLKLSLVYQCTGCDSFHLQPLARTVNKNNSVRQLPAHGPVVPQECSDCGRKFVMGGPIWSDPIHDPDWILSTLSNVVAMKHRYPAYEKVHSVLTSVSEELLDVPLSVDLHNICSTLKCTAPSSVVFKSALINAGYKASGTHTNPNAVKTDAPMNVIWDIMRCWIKTHPVKKQQPDQPGSVILSKDPTLEANFARAHAALSHAQSKKIARFLPNPESYWGPKPRAGRKITGKHTSLVGPDVVKRFSQQEDDNVPSAKRQKPDDESDH